MWASANESSIELRFTSPRNNSKLSDTAIVLTFETSISEISPSILGFNQGNKDTHNSWQVYLTLSRLEWSL
ncbi:MAG: hypothetical protein WAqPseu_34860 [Shewanella algae]